MQARAVKAPSTPYGVHCNLHLAKHSQFPPCHCHSCRTGEVFMDKQWSHSQESAKLLQPSGFAHPTRPTSSQRQNLQTSLPRGNRVQKEFLCQDWNYATKCSCLTTGATYSTTHRCCIWDSSDHPMLHHAKCRFPIPASPSPGANQDQAKEWLPQRIELAN